MRPHNYLPLQDNISFLDQDDKQIQKIAEQLADGYRHYFLYTVEKNFQRATNPTTNEIKNEAFGQGFTLMTVGLYLLIPAVLSLIIASGQTIKKKLTTNNKDANWFYNLASNLVLLNNSSNEEKQTFIQQCVTEYRTQKKPMTLFSGPTIYTASLMKDLLNLFPKSQDENNNTLMKLLVDYLKNPANDTSLFYQILLTNLEKMKMQKTNKCDSLSF